MPMFKGIRPRTPAAAIGRRRARPAVESCENRTLLTTSLVAGVLQVVGTAADDTVQIALRPGDPSIIDVFENGSGQSFNLADVQRIDVQGLGGLDTLTLDFRNGAFFPPNGVNFDGGAVNEGNILEIVGGPADSARLGFNAGQPVVSVNGNPIGVQNVDRYGFGPMAGFTFVSPGSRDNIVIFTNSAARTVVTGTSDGVPIPIVELFGPDRARLDLASNDVPGIGDDQVRYTQIPGLPVSTQSFDILTGIDNDFVDLTGTLGSHFVELGFGNDTALGGDGSDSIFGGPGDDFIHGGGNGDLLVGGDGNDTIHGGDGDDVILGGAGDDVIFTGPGDNIVDAGEGDDRVEAGDGNNVITGGPGNDVIIAGDGDNELYGGDGDDFILAGNGDNIIAGGLGFDVLEAGDGSNILDAGLDGLNETVVVGSGLNIVYVHRIYGYLSEDVVRSNAGGSIIRRFGGRLIDEFALDEPEPAPGAEAEPFGFNPFLIGPRISNEALVPPSFVHRNGPRRGSPRVPSYLRHPGAYVPFDLPIQPFAANRAQRPNLNLGLANFRRRPGR